jgi:hypothetical protein
MSEDDPMPVDKLAAEAAVTRRQEMARKAADVSEALEERARYAHWDEPEVRVKAREVAAYLKEQAK